MTLVVPDTSSGETDTRMGEWETKLVGKTIGDFHSVTTFKKSDLPQKSRIIEPGSVITRDYNPYRLNIFVKEDGVISHVNFQ
ncbi:BgTH12-03072 [Blumeria graminis f. sp. triticale]|uniref:Bgt-3988 n=3 Tax=Blumeria graminis TaxID=34373 RepID=A0A061HN48_BLUGR|nr:hypothetical protein BGT96224_3988 [Blumeria graminis f. sp. tritici 96224]CAD6503407.1 BgTH12-03072 [Blumeria graminis f. sp. triticale]VDB89494.1 Bgt-3988 [Blumeria graminis f. sp. tritici]